MSAAPVRLGVVGLGYWGPNLARNFDALPGCELAWCCDERQERRQRLEVVHRSTRFTDRFEDLLEDPALDAIALATPVPTHASLAERVLAAGKHCFVEKPLAQSAADAEAV
ncbi:MAG: Gfo/Idh/MocA family oxidoreductase, partial [Solirubrobacteraceae bacterium]